MARTVCHCEEGTRRTRTHRVIQMENVSPRYRGYVSDLLGVPEETLFSLRKPLEDVIHDYSVRLLEREKSHFVWAHQKEIDRLNSELNNAVDVIRNSKNPKAKAISVLPMPSRISLKRW
mgnify:CR=1 FL=1